MQGCVFCAILAGELPARMVWEDAQVVAFMDLRQAVPGHVLVVPRQHAETLYALDEALAGQVMRVTHRVARALRDTLAPDGLNLWQSNGEAGGQEVPHFHLHVQPRRHGDGLLEVYPMGVPAPSTMAQLEPLAARLRNALGGGSQQVPAPQHAAQ